MHILLDARSFPHHDSSNQMYSEDLFQALLRNFPSDIFYIWTTGKDRQKNIFSFSLEIYPNAKRIHTYISTPKLDFFLKNFQYPKIDDIVETEAMKRGQLPWTGKIDAAIYLMPYNSPTEKNCLKIQCINDFSPLHFSQFFSQKEKKIHTFRRYQKEIENSDLLVVPSKFVKEDLLKTFSRKSKESAEKIFILGSGILEMITSEEEGPLPQIPKNIKQKNKPDENHQEDQNPEETIEEKLPKKIFFARGIFSQLNNFLALLKAYNLFSSRFGNESWKLVIEEEREGDLKEIADGNNSYIILPPLSLEERIRVLKKTEVFLYPSLYDGVGKPLLEAMRCGCAIASSEFGALPEIYGDCALSFDPTSHISLLQTMKMLFQDKKLRTYLSKKAKERSYQTEFLWDDIAQTLMQIIEKKREEKDEEQK